MPDAFSAKWRQPGGMKRVIDTLRRIEKAMDADLLVTWAGPKVVGAIKSRTTSGRDLNDQNFVPYSTRSALGRRYVNEFKGGRTQPVTLTRTGIMQGNLKARKKGRAKVTVSVVGAHADLAPKHQHGLDGVPRRSWLGMSPSDMRQLNADTLIFIERDVLKLGGPGLSTVGSLFKSKQPWTVKNPV